MDQPFEVPALGERGDVADNELPVQALRLSQNVFRADNGILTIRPGYKKLPLTSSPGGRIMGVGYFKTVGGSERQIAANKNQVWQFDGAAWANITGIGLSGGDFDHVRFTTFYELGVYKTIITNSVNTPKTWDGGATTYSELGGNPGVSIDACVCANRLLLLQAPNRVRISEFNNSQIWPAGAGFLIDLIDAGDFMVGMETLTRTAVAVLGDESQWVLRSQSGAFPFKPERISEEVGPMSCAAIVNHGSAVYYLGDDYNVYRFDGVACTAVGWAMKNWVKNNINVSNKRMAHGEFFDLIGKIFWFFPAGSATAPNYGIHYDPKTGEMGRLYFGNRAITASGRVKVIVTVAWNDLIVFDTWDDLPPVYPTWDSFGDPSPERRLALGTSDGNVNIAATGDGSDDGAPIEALWEVPLKTYAGWPSAVVPDTFETFFQQTPSSTMAELYLGHTDTLMGNPVYVLVDTFDLATRQRNDVDLTQARVKEARFVTIRQRINALKGGVGWQGGLFRYQSSQVVKGPTSDNS